MVIYNVTCNISAELSDEWVSWMKTIHIPEVMETAMFEKYMFSKMITTAPDETGNTYSIQYFAKNMENYEIYIEKFAPILQAKTKEKYGDKLMAFRSLMESLV